jgi:hypothetical protein
MIGFNADITRAETQIAKLMAVPWPPLGISHGVFIYIRHGRPVKNLLPQGHWTRHRFESVRTLSMSLNLDPMRVWELFPLPANQTSSLPISNK